MATKHPLILQLLRQLPEPLRHRVLSARRKPGTHEIVVLVAPEPPYELFDGKLPRELTLPRNVAAAAVHLTLVMP